MYYVCNMHCFFGWFFFGCCCFCFLHLCNVYFVTTIHCNLHAERRESILNGTVGGRPYRQVNSIGLKHMPAFSVNTNLCHIICCHFFAIRHTWVKDVGNLQWALGFVSISRWPMCVCVSEWHHECTLRYTYYISLNARHKTFCAIQKYIYKQSVHMRMCL